MEDPAIANGGIANFSRLPDELLSRILSLLSTEDAVRTSVLSMRLRYSYTSISNLVLEFNSELHKYSDEKDCLNFVDRFLFYGKNCVLDKFKLKWKMSQALDPLQLESWIKVALWYGIRNLDLFMCGFELNNLLLPSSLFTCKTLEVLELNIWLDSNDSNTVLDDLEPEYVTDSIPDYEVYDLFAKICLPLLKSIRLKNVNFSRGVSWSRLFSNCPVLEDFFV